MRLEYDPKSLMTSGRPPGPTVTAEEFDAVLDRQGGVCAVCQTRNKAMEIDFYPETNSIRGILCHYCNKARGLVADDPHVLRSMIKYLGENR